MLFGMSTIATEPRPTDRAELAAWYEAIIDEQERSGLSVTEAAEEVGVTAATLYSWKRRLCRADTEVARSLVRVHVPDAEYRPSTSATLVLRLRQGRAIEIPDGFDADELARLIAVVDAC